MKIYLRTLTPVHIGTGENLHSLDYVLLGKNYYRVSQTQFSRFLQGLANPDEQIEKFVEWMGDITERLSNLEYDYKTARDHREKRDYNQQLRDLKKQLRLDLFCKEEGLEREFSSFLNNPGNNIPKYKIKGQVKQQIRGLITTASKQHYLPGTTLKGSLRTALLYQVMMDDKSGTHKRNLINDIEKCLSDKRMRPVELRKKMGKELEYSIAYCGQLDRRGNRDFRDEKMDLFKFLEVADARFLSGTDPVEVVASDLYLVSKPGGRFGKANRDAPKVALKQPQAPGLEAIRRGITFHTNISVNVAVMYEIYKTLPPNNQRKYWIDMERKVKALFGIDLRSMNQANLSEYEIKAQTYLHQAITRFATAQAIFEQDQWLEKQMLSRDFDRNMPDKAVFREPFDFISNYDHNGCTLLRTGFATGFAGKTELLSLLGDDELRAAFTKVMAKLELGKRPGVRDAKAYEPNLATFPKSRLLISYKDSVSPLGWVEFIPEKEWEKVKDKLPTSTQSVVAQKPSEPIKPQYPSSKVRKGSILDAFVFKIPGPEKKVRVYVGKNRDVDLMISYRADVILGKIILVEVSNMTEETVNAVKFKGLKKENR